MTVFTKALPNPHGDPDGLLLADLEQLKLVRKLMNGNKNHTSSTVTTAVPPSIYVPAPLAAAAPAGGYAHPCPAATPQQYQVSVPLVGAAKGAKGAKKSGGAAKPSLPPPSARERTDIDIAIRQPQAAQQTATAVPGATTCKNCTRNGRNPHHN